MSGVFITGTDSEIKSDDVSPLETFMAEWGFEQPYLAEDVPVHCRGLDYIVFIHPFQPKAFYGSMIQ